MKDVGQQALEIAALRHAAPYIRMYRGKTFVLKVGGGACVSRPILAALLEQVDVLRQVGIRCVLVHGGGPQASALLGRLGGTPRFAAGRRVTDDLALEAALLALNGEVRTRVLCACRALGIEAAGVSGVDASLLRARRRSPVAVEGEGLVDYGHVGDLVGVAPAVVDDLLDAGRLAVVSPLAADDAGNPLNVNADTAAAALAVALAAEKLILLTEAAGILERHPDPGSLVSYTDLAGLRDLRTRGALDGGMLPKVAAIEQALAGGVPRVHVVSYAQHDGLLGEIFTNEGVGTLVVAERADPVAVAAGGGG